MMTNSGAYQQMPPHLGPIPENNFGGGGGQSNNHLSSATRATSSWGGGSNLDQAAHHNMKLMNQGGGGGSSTSSAVMDHHSSLTRDFLGVKGVAGSPFSPQDLAKLASMSSATGGLSQFDGNNH
ncbi:hypothetical protein SAY86_005845 [Trapa natans]|uniref:Uncharacterized protein n=1 Tax=Trapa natans TaxID=22666 RepID=A0AAN7LA18_TRANT|nr:hypothetical protein SAY86_005845 [Trapa natans]